MVNAFDSIVRLDEKADFKEYIEKLYLYNIFKPVFDEYPDIETSRLVIKFILYGFSMESDMLMTAGNIWEKIAKNIFTKLCLPDELYEDVCLLKNVSVQMSMQRWVQFNNEENWSNFVTFRELRRQFISLSLSDLKKSSGEIDIQAKMDAATYARDLLKMMEDSRMSFIMNNPKLKGSVDALNKSMKQKETLGPQNYAK